DEDTLKHINVTGKDFNLGLLRNDGRFTWPSGLSDLLPVDEKKDIEIRAQNAVTQATTGRVDPNLIKDLRAGVKKMRALLTSKISQIPTPQYVDAKRFLNNFDDAVDALAFGDATNFFAFQKFASSPRNVSEVVAYMAEKGLQFAPAVEGDEPYYQALHTALVAYDVAVNTQLAANTPSTPPNTKE